jgi:short-subunit dehydrogenase
MMSKIGRVSIKRSEGTALEGKGVLLTGASGGLGPEIGRVLAERGARLVLASLPGPELEAVAAELSAHGATVSVCPADLTRDRELDDLVRRAQAELGAVDVLINGAGLERMLEFDRLTASDLDAVVAVNLTAPMKLTRQLVPGMLERGWGRVISLASLAAKAAPPYAGPYAATKAGIIAFTRSLRAEYRARGVSASAIVPGFVRGAGMYDRMERGTGARAPRLVGVTTPEAVGRAVVYALERDPCEVIVNAVPVRALCGLAEVFPDLGGRIGRWFGSDAVLQGWARFNERSVEGAK